MDNMILYCFTLFYLADPATFPALNSVRQTLFSSEISLFIQIWEKKETILKTT